MDTFDTGQLLLVTVAVLAVLAAMIGGAVTAILWPDPADDSPEVRGSEEADRIEHTEDRDAA